MQLRLKAGHEGQLVIANTYARGQRREKMNEETLKAINELHEALLAERDYNCVAVNIFFNSEGYEIERRYKTANQLTQSGISMRNINGIFITGKN